MTFKDLVVIVPWLTLAMPQLNDANTFLDQLSGDEHLSALHSWSVHVEDMLGLFRHVEYIHGFLLHAIGKLHRLDAGFEHRIIASFLEMFSIHALDKVQFASLGSPRKLAIDNVFDEFLDTLVLGVDIGPLVDTGQKTGLPVLRFLDWITAWAHGDESREVLVVGTESVGEPRSEARSDQARLTAIHQKERWFVVGDISVHGTNHAKFIGMGAGGLFE